MDAFKAIYGRKYMFLNGQLTPIPWKAKTIKIIVPNLGWLKFPTKKKVFGENWFLW